MSRECLACERLLRVDRAGLMKNASELSLLLLRRTQVRAKGLKPWHAVTLGAGFQTCVKYLCHDGPFHVPLKLQTEGPTVL